MRGFHEMGHGGKDDKKKAPRAGDLMLDLRVFRTSLLRLEKETARSEPSQHLCKLIYCNHEWSR